MNGFESKFQIGKNGLTQTVIDSLETHLKTHRQVRISVLKSATREKAELKKLAEELQEKLSCNTQFKILGFTIILRRLSRKKQV